MQKRRIKESCRDERGEMMIESILVMIPTLFVLVFILCLGFFFYQEWNVQTSATETANKIAELYPILGAELNTGVTDYSQIEDVSKYRYLFGDSNQISANQARGESYGKSYLSIVSLAYPSNPPEVSIEVIEDAFACRHIKVTVAGDYTLPFSEGFEVFGLKGKYHFIAEGEALSTDYSDYISSIVYLANLETLLNLNNFSGYKAANSILSAIVKVFQMVKGLF